MSAPDVFPVDLSPLLKRVHSDWTILGFLVALEQMEDHAFRAFFPLFLEELPLKTHAITMVVSRSAVAAKHLAAVKSILGDLRLALEPMASAGKRKASSGPQEEDDRALKRARTEITKFVSKAVNKTKRTGKVAWRTTCLAVEGAWIAAAARAVTPAVARIGSAAYDLGTSVVGGTQSALVTTARYVTIASTTVTAELFRANFEEPARVFGQDFTLQQLGAQILSSLPTQPAEFFVYLNGTAAGVENAPWIAVNTTAFLSRINPLPANDTQLVAEISESASQHVGTGFVLTGFFTVLSQYLDYQIESARMNEDQPLQNQLVRLRTAWQVISTTANFAVFFSSGAAAILMAKLMPFFGTAVAAGTAGGNAPALLPVALTIGATLTAGAALKMLVKYAANMIRAQHGFIKIQYHGDEYPETLVVKDRIDNLGGVWDNDASELKGRILARIREEGMFKFDEGKDRIQFMELPRQGGAKFEDDLPPDRPISDFRFTTIAVRVMRKLGDDDNGVQLAFSEQYLAKKGIAIPEAPSFFMALVDASGQTIPAFPAPPERVLVPREFFENPREGAIEKLSQDIKRQIADMDYYTTTFFNGSDNVIFKLGQSGADRDGTTLKEIGFMKVSDLFDKTIYAHVTDGRGVRKVFKQRPQQRQQADNQLAIVRRRDRGAAASAALSAVGSGPDEIEAAARLLLSSGMFF